MAHAAQPSFALQMSRGVMSVPDFNAVLDQLSGLVLTAAGKRYELQDAGHGRVTAYELVEVAEAGSDSR